jgi:hypothetical protein
MESNFYRSPDARLIPRVRENPWGLPGGSPDAEATGLRCEAPAGLLYLSDPRLGTVLVARLMSPEQTSFIKAVAATPRSPLARVRRGCRAHEVAVAASLHQGQGLE